MKASAISVVSSALGLPCWQVRWDRQIGLDMNFGAPHMEIREPRVSTAKSPRVRAQFARRGVHLRGTHWLVISAATWRLELANGLVVRDTSSVKKLDMAVARVRGEKLNGLAVEARTGTTTFYFDLGAHIIVRGPAAEDVSDGELWSLNDKRRVVAVLGGGFYETGSVTRGRHAAEHIDAGASGFVIVARSARMRREITRKLQLAAV